MTTHANAPLGFRDSGRIKEFYFPNLPLARAEGRKLKVQPAKVQRDMGKRRLLVLIDMQWDFSDKGRLPVKGTFDDTQRVIDRIIRGTEQEVYTDVILTLDEHPPHTIHSDSWWEDDKGNRPDATLPVRMVLTAPNTPYPFTGFFVDGSTRPYRVRLGKKMAEWTQSYAEHLKKTGQGDAVWVFTDHCRIGTEGTSLIPALAEAVEWMCAARDIQPAYMRKGHIAEVDWFGPFRPCMDVPNHPQGGLQAEYLDRMSPAEVITDVAGEAADFCVKAGMAQVLEYFGQPGKESTLQRINFITDGTSPIFPDDPAKGSTPNADFRKLMQGKGVKMIKASSAF